MGNVRPYVVYKLLSACALGLISVACVGAAVWDGSAPVTMDVIDQDLDISNTSGNPVYLANPITVAANTRDITVTVTNGDAIVTSSFPLYFYAAGGQSIALEIDMASLIFTGTEAQQFLITFSGLGNLNVIFTNTAYLDFGLTATTEPGVIFVDLIPDGATHQIAFRLDSSGDGNANRGVSVGYNSTMTFAYGGGDSNASSTWLWDATNSVGNTGRLTLQVYDNAGVIVSPCVWNIGETPASPVISDFSFPDTVPNNTITANFTTVNNAPDGSYSAPLIINQNQTWKLLNSNPFCEDFPEGYNTPRTGFIVASNGVVNVVDQTYIDYVVTVTNITVYPNIPPSILDEPCQRFLTQVIKDRNAAALLIDGDVDVNTYNPAIFNFTGNSALYLRSGVNCQGQVNTYVDPSAPDPVYSFTVSPDQNFHTEGTIVLDIEGELIMNGDPNGGESAVQILSLQVAPTGGSVLITSSDTNFPLRTFARDSADAYLQYGSACALVNNLWYLRQNMHLQHTDMLHPIFYNGLLVEPTALSYGDVNTPYAVASSPLQQSAASYIGGDRLNFNCPNSYPTDNRIILVNSFLDVHSSGAMTGLDLTVTEDLPVLVGAPDFNQSVMTFYSNGRCIDQGTGRVWVMGTEIGCEASDYQTVIDRDAHLDIISADPTGGNTLQLNLNTDVNNNKITEGIVGDISQQFSVHTIYLGWASNITVGDFGVPDMTSSCILNINGSYFSFMTQGGTIFDPSSGATTGQGALFVDNGGIAQLGTTALRANMGMMGVVSGSGILNLPTSSVYYSPRVGIAQWELDLSQPSQLVIIPANVALSDYTLDWQNITHDFCGSGTVFVPYEPTTIPAPGFAPAVTTANLTGLPTVQGEVDQFQIKNSRLGNQANLLVDGGFIRELVFETGEPSTSLPLGTLVLQNNAFVGLGTAQRSTDSVDAEMMLGINGLMLIANGDATLQLNCNTLINNLCQILSGTAFGLSSGGNRLEITSVVPTELRVKSGGFLDLSQFTTINQTLTIGGQVRLVLEPGAQVLLGGGNLLVQEQAQIYCEPNTNLTELSSNTGTTNYTDNWRVRFMGPGRITIKEDAQFIVPRDAVVGIEQPPQSDTPLPDTSQSWLLSDNSTLQLGSATQYGGVFQVGSAVDPTTSTNSLVTFSLILDGVGATVDVNSQGMLGLGVGIAGKAEVAPNQWLVQALGGIGSITIINREGFFKNQQIYTGDNKLAGLLAIGDVITSLDPPSTRSAYTFQFDQTNGEILGGGNMAFILTTTYGVAPTVQNLAFTAPSGIVTPGISCSELQLQDYSKRILATQVGNMLQVNNVTGAALFNYLAMNGYTQQAGKTAAIFQSSLGQTTIGFIDNQTNPLLSQINRLTGFPIRGLNGTYVNAGASLSVGTVGLLLNGPNVQIFEISPGNP